jgi:transcriptional regulator with XRE-family HTH domain
MSGDPDLIALGQTVRQLREERDIDTRSLATAAGVEPRRLEAIEAGRQDPRYDVLLALAGGLGVEVEVLVATILRLARSVGVQPGELVEGLQSEPGEGA